MQTKCNNNKYLWALLFAAWLIAMIATLGSLFLSEIMSFPPCTLCWYQRIFMYPLVIVLLVGLICNDGSVFQYALPLTCIGWLFALYHNLIHFGIIPESASPCIMGVPCSTKYLQLLGFVTIPLMSFMAFTIILIFLILARRSIDYEK